MASPISREKIHQIELDINCLTPDLDFVKKFTWTRFLGEIFTRKSENYKKCKTKQRKINNGNLTLGKLTLDKFS